MSTVLEVLKGARALIEDESRWRKLCFGGIRGPWCAEGACFYAAGLNGAGESAIHVLDDLLPDWDCVMAFNDHERTTHADILALFDRAIAAEEAKLAPSPETVPQATPRRRDAVGCVSRSLFPLDRGART